MAQQMASVDLAVIRNMRHHINGINVSGFYHFNPKLSCGIELNRFFKTTKQVNEENVEMSAWDVDLNVHYLLPFSKKLKWYPICGISHTSEKERDPAAGATGYERCWSFNTGAGMLLSLGKWSPHMEYLFTWGPINQQFLLAGISYEIAWRKEK